jgi:hypothetical protein
MGTGKRYLSIVRWACFAPWHRNMQNVHEYCFAPWHKNMQNVHEYCFAPWHRNMQNVHEYCFAPLHRNMQNVHEYCFAPLHRNMQNVHVHCFAPLHRNMHNLQHISFAMFQLMCYSIRNHSLSSRFKSRPRHELILFVSFFVDRSKKSPQSASATSFQIPSRSLFTEHHTVRDTVSAINKFTLEVITAARKNVLCNVTPCRL